jgi:hypothetical protein
MTFAPGSGCRVVIAVDMISRVFRSRACALKPLVPKSVAIAKRVIMEPFAELAVRLLIVYNDASRQID